MSVPHTGENNRNDLISAYLIDNYEASQKKRDSKGYTGITTDL